MGLYQPWAGEETNYEHALAGNPNGAPQALPIYPQHMLPALFTNLSRKDNEYVLRYKIVPIVFLPHQTLYGAAGLEAQANAERIGLRVVVQISPVDFRAAVQNHFGPQLLSDATFGLQREKSKFSAHRRFTSLQIVWTFTFMACFLMAAAAMPSEYSYALASLFFGLFFLSVIALRLFCLIEKPGRKEAQPSALTDFELPVYSVLVPVFRETRVLRQLISSLLQLKYPIEKLDIKIITEENDVAMRRAISAMSLPAHFDVIVVPAGKPQTKPRALNYALQFARGKLLTIYDAEDIPEPMQLRKAAARFALGPRDLACLQAELAFFNSNENWLTRQFTVEYSVLFKLLLPSLAVENLPLLLGGTSNHFRTSILRKVGGWDPFNVTEDADLGLRLARLGYLVSTLNSVTFEEANTEFNNWLQQRSRWLKGFLQTWLVHMRAPAAMIRSIGLDGFWVMQATTLGIFISALLHPFLLTHAIYVLISGTMITPDASYAKHLIASLNFTVLFSGYCISIIAGWKALRRKRISGWWFVLATMPLYWLLMSIAGWMALWQFAFKPFHWNKTRHGLSTFQKDHVEN